MPERHPAAEFVRLFPTEEIPKIVQNILQACQTLRREKPCEIENKISSRLYKRLIRFPDYRTGPLTIVPLWESPIINFADDEVEITGRADILFLFPGGSLETYFLVEAKRLFVPSSGKVSSLFGKYIDEGMMRFVHGQYASKMKVGAMLGYVFDKSLSEAKAALSVAVDKRKEELKITAGGQWLESSLAVSPPVDETRHVLDQGAFTMYHILTQV